MKTWKKAALALSAIGVAGSTAAFATSDAGRGMFMKQMIAHRVSAAEDLIDATPAQRQVIDQARENVVATLEKHFAAHKEARGQWLALLTADKLDATQIVDAANKHADAIRSIAAEVAPEIVKVHDALTPAQRAKLAEHLKSMHAHHHRHDGDQGGFGGHDQEQ